MSDCVSDLRVALTCSTLPPVVVGPPGIGKSTRIKQLATELGWTFHCFSVGDVGEGAFGVVPVPSNGYLDFPPARWVQQFTADQPGLLFLDDVHAAPPALQAPIAGLVLDGRIGDYTLPKSVRRVAAMNPISQGAGAWDFAASLANRFCYLTWASPTATEWTDWLVQQPETTAGWTRARQLASAFHRCNGDKLSEDPATALADRFPPAYATPRSWEAAVRVQAGCIDAGMEHAFPRLCEGCIGRPVTVEYLTWLRRNDLPDPELLLSDPSLWEPNSSEPDKAFATAAAVADAATRKHKNKAKRWFAAWAVLQRGLHISRGTVAIAARKLADPKHRPDNWREDAVTVAVVKELREVLEMVQ